jgi:diguanylate cyclase (GGDEF)-like protein
VQNKRAYDHEVSRLNEEIESDPQHAKFGIVMVDLNDLKKMNDVYGHEKGDMGITILCAVVCSIFKYSAVFRIGGDEFAVILEGDDYDFAQELLQELNDEL